MEETSTNNLKTTFPDTPDGMEKAGRFIDDVKNPNYQHIFAAMQVNPNLIGAWDDVTNFIGVNTKFRNDIEHLESLVNIKNNNNVALLDEFCATPGPGCNGYRSFVEKYSDVACDECGNPPNYYMPKIQEVFDNIEYAGLHLSAFNPGYQDLLTAIKNSAPNVRQGTQFMLSRLKARFPEAAGIEAIDAAFPPGADCQACRFDVKLAGVSPKYIEYKSYASTTTFTQIKQFKEYFRDIASLEELNYIFDKRKLTIDQARTNFRDFLNTGDNKNQLWEVISMNPNLYNELIGSGTGDPFERFENLIGNVGDNSFSSFYNFIEVLLPNQ